MASVHTKVTFQAFNGLEHGMVGACFFVCIILMKGKGSLKDMSVYSWRSYIRQVRTHTPDEDMYFW